jgi:hypothetical protein
VPQPVDLCTWRDVLLSENGPPDPLTRLVLLAIGQHMKAKEEHGCAWPGQELIAERSGVALRSVRRHLEKAAAGGWVSRKQVRRANRHGWFRTEYTASLPDQVIALLQQHPATVAPCSDDTRPDTTQQEANGDTTGGQPVHNRRPSFGRLTLNGTPNRTPNRNSPENSSEEADQNAKVNGLANELDLRAKILALPFMKAGEVAHALRASGATVEEVLRVREAAGGAKV